MVGGNKFGVWCFYMRKQLLLLAVFFALMISLSEISFAQQKSQARDVLVFEISRTSNPGGYRGNLTSSHIFNFYQSGRIACGSISYDPRGKQIKSKRMKCIQISKSKIEELIELAEQTDFLEAKDSYSFFAGGVDHGKTFSIRYFRKNGKKEIFLTNPKQSGNDIPLPPSVTTFLQRISEINETLKVDYELGEKSNPSP